jgi:hypothetical protein
MQPFVTKMLGFPPKKWFNDISFPLHFGLIKDKKGGGHLKSFPMVPFLNFAYSCMGVGNDV